MKKVPGLDTKNHNPPFPKGVDDPLEMPAREDKDRYVLARVWDFEQRKEIAQLRGPGSVLHGGVQRGMCWLRSPGGASTAYRCGSS